jgi:parallel beta-helix repeat protein
MSNGENVMAIENSNGNTIDSNFMEFNTNMGFGLFGSTNNTISGNIIGGNGEFGLKLTNSPGNVIKNNQITFNKGDGLVLENSEGNIITDNDIKSNKGDGIRLLNSNKNKLMGNLIDASVSNVDTGGLGDGIFIENSQLNTISKNDITNNEANGINLFDSSDNIIINNNFVNNPNHILDDFGVNNQFNQPLPIGGNYYDTFDESGEGCQDVAPANGICDDPFVFSGGEDKAPWTKPNGWLNPPQPPKTIYKGEGQRADVNEFLMYTSPKEGSTILPSRVSDYMLEIMYGDTINPSTFSAKMGKNDITSLFNPQPDKTEKISIPLIDGKNSLSLSVEGIRSDGKKSSDKDKLVFIVGGAMRQGLSTDQGLDWFIPPIKQVKQGTLPQDVVCQPQLDLIFKSSDGSPKCVSSIAAEKLVERGWATR